MADRTLRGMAVLPELSETCNNPQVPRPVAKRWHDNGTKLTQECGRRLQITDAGGHLPRSPRPSQRNSWAGKLGCSQSP